MANSFLSIEKLTQRYPDGKGGEFTVFENASFGIEKGEFVCILGHSGCGGVEGCYDMCSGNAPELEEASSFVGRWMEILRPGYAALKPGDDAARKTALEKASVVISLENLMTFPFVRSAVESERLSIHGLWNDIGEGGLEAYDPRKESFYPI